MEKNDNNGGRSNPNGNNDFDSRRYLAECRDGKCSVEGEVSVQTPPSKMETLLNGFVGYVSAARARIYEASAPLSEFLRKYF